jgi:hypothetical protein
MSIRTIDQCKRLIKEATSQLNQHPHTVPTAWLAQIALDTRSLYVSTAASTTLHLLRRKWLGVGETNPPIVAIVCYVVWDFR